MNTIDTIFTDVNNAKANLVKVESQFFNVFVAPVGAQHYKNPNTGKLVTIPASTENFRVFTCEGLELSLMKGQFVPMQPKEFYDNIISTVHEFGADLDLNTLKFRRLANSKKIEFSIRMKPFTFINNKKVVDETNMEVTFSTSYDGSKSNTIALYTERVVCTNGMVASKLEGVLKGRNTLSGKAKILSYASELAQIINGAVEFKEKMEALDKIKLNKAQIEQFKLEMFKVNQKELNTNGKSIQANFKRAEVLNNFEKAMFLTEIEFEDLPNDYFSSEKFNTDFKDFKESDYLSMTAFEVLQSVTRYTNHHANIKTERDLNIRFGSGFDLNNKAQELLFSLIEPTAELVEA